MNITPMFIGSLFLPGSAQIYNRQYWKLPIIYGGIAAFTTGAIVGKKNIRPYMVGGAVATWYLSVLDGVISYKSYQNPLGPPYWPPSYPAWGRRGTETTGRFHSTTADLP